MPSVLYMFACVFMLRGHTINRQFSTILGHINKQIETFSFNLWLAIERPLAFDYWIKCGQPIDSHANQATWNAILWSHSHSHFQWNCHMTFIRNLILSRLQVNFASNPNNIRFSSDQETYRTGKRMNKMNVKRERKRKKETHKRIELHLNVSMCWNQMLQMLCARSIIWTFEQWAYQWRCARVWIYHLLHALLIIHPA